MSDLISRQAAIDALCKACMLTSDYKKCEGYKPDSRWCEEITTLRELPSAQPEQKYTNKELRVFMHGISMRLLSLRSAQHWTYDDETAEEIKFLERLYKKVESEVTQ